MIAVIPKDAPCSAPFKNELLAAALRSMKPIYETTINRGSVADAFGRTLLDLPNATWQNPPFVCAKHASKGKECWNPLVLRQGYTKQKRFENWFILESWSVWQTKCYTMADRAVDFYKKFLPNVHVPKSNKRRVGAFRHRVSFLGLPASQRRLF